ncbi:MAG: 4-carboxymuconolactone decarboxylase [Spirochaetes bacterium GWD1_27_9]|nr:MAG: 4-carboxymuconolactone decarboxylase [Spirochaetes bacterium GWB1_27_13]OHD23372.1 MAG: 4-carboxymuconolactone decarboxylase [Spirochaetes bacterium GWC1_27_15]OHD34808.1 MAG: 4-carboxymuconolactone decarboxylase [Spirochaetes bacterium GWD1_27_9]
MNQNPLDVIKNNDDALFNNVLSGRKLAFQDGALSAKHKILIALALDAAHGSSTGVKSLAKQALDAGATKEEILETLRVTLYISGVGSVYTAAYGLNEIF